MAIPISFIEIQVFVHATEDADKVMVAAKNILPSQWSEEISFTRDDLEGHHGNPIILLKAKIRKKQLTKAFLEHLTSKLSEESKSVLSLDIKRYLDDQGGFYVRLDKQSAFLNKLKLGYEDPIRVYVKFNLQRKPLEDLVKTFRELGLLR